VAGDKGYHSKQTMRDLNEISIRSFMSEPDRGRQKWGEDIETRNLIYDNRRRIRGDRGKRLLRRRGELVERSFAHCYETGGMRRLHLRGRENITKRVLIHAAGFNLGLLMRVSYGLKKPRGLTARARALILWLWTRCIALIRSMRDRLSDLGALLMTNRAHAPRLAA
jgi:transposase